MRVDGHADASFGLLVHELNLRVCQGSIRECIESAPVHAMAISLSLGPRRMNAHGPVLVGALVGRRGRT